MHPHAPSPFTHTLHLDPAAAPIITSDHNMVVVIAGPMNDDIDIAERRWLKLAFVTLALTNLIVTSLIFMHVRRTAQLFV